MKIYLCRCHDKPCYKSEQDEKKSSHYTLASRTRQSLGSWRCAITKERCKVQVTNYYN